MPFTLAHPAVVIPLGQSGLKLSLTGLIIGSMIPDFEFFFMLREVENIGHKWYGILLFDIPLAYLIAYLYHNVLRNVIIDHLPKLYRKRFREIKSFDWNLYAGKNKWRIFISIFIGIISHFCLDAFTHHDGLFVEILPFLSQSISFSHNVVPVYFVLQILFSLLGMFIVHLQVLGMPVLTNEQPVYGFSTISYWIIFGILFTSILSTRLAFWPEWNTFGGILIAIMGSLLYSWIAVSLLFNSYIKKQKILS
jgi:hypothetical protein